MKNIKPGTIITYTADTISWSALVTRVNRNRKKRYECLLLTLSTANPNIKKQIEEEFITAYSKEEIGNRIPVTLNDLFIRCNRYRICIYGDV